MSTRCFRFRSVPVGLPGTQPRLPRVIHADHWGSPSHVDVRQEMGNLTGVDLGQKWLVHYYPCSCGSAVPQRRARYVPLWWNQVHSPHLRIRTAGHPEARNGGSGER